MDLKIPAEHEALLEACKAFSKRHLSQNYRTFESQKRLSDEAVKGFNELSLNELYIKFPQENQETLAATLATFELASVDAGWLFYYNNPGPASGAALIATSSEPLKNLMSNPMSIFLTEENFLGFGVSTTDDIKDKEFIGFGATGAHHLLIATNSSLIYVGPDDCEFKELRLGAFDASAPVKITVKETTTTQTPVDFSTLTFIKSYARLFTSSVMLGAASGALEHAIAYGKERIVFNLPVLGHQANAFSVAKCKSMLEALKTKLTVAASLFPQELSSAKALNLFSWLASSLYIQAIEAAKHVTDVAVLLLGGHGYMEDEPVEKYWREVRTCSLFYGGRDSAMQDLQQLLELVSDPMVI
jgi:alkylation response protein AidB-like acyl-CoA dehydrogenase